MKTNYSKEQINRRLALLCGVDQQMLGWWDEYQTKMAEYKQSRHHKNHSLVVELQQLMVKLGGFELANYYHDLNAMYNAEKALWRQSTKLFDDYIREIYKIVDARTTNGEVGLEVLDPFDVTTVLWRYANAPTRAEAMYAVLRQQPTE